MNETTKALMKIVTGVEGDLEGAYNIREDSGCAARHSTELVKIESKTDQPGIDITIAPGAKESVFIPAFVTHGEITDLVYNDFFIGEEADITLSQAVAFIRMIMGMRFIMEFIVFSLARMQGFSTLRNM